MNKKSLGLSIVSTPIGNLDDISKRAIEVIGGCDYIICENPKHSLKLLNNLGIKKKLISLHDYNESLVIDRIASDLRIKTIVLISDAGSPLVSDPGYRLVKYCIDENINITSIPGPTSIIAALQLSGLPMNEFTFLGYLPKAKSQIIKFIERIKKSNNTVVFFVSSHKIIESLEIMEEIIPEEKISISKELTKINEKIYRGFVKNIKREITTNTKNIKGEFVITIGENNLNKSKIIDLNEYDEEIKKLLLKFSLTDVVEIVHKLSRIKKNEVYKWVLNIKNL